MCKYCEKKKEIGARDEYYHADEEIDIGSIGSLIFRIIQFGNEEWDPSIDTSVEFYDSKEDHYTLIFQKQLGINYCPFCGRKLSEESE